MSSEVSITNNDDNSINLEITAYKNEVRLEFTESNEASLVVHDKAVDAHSNIITPITRDINVINVDLSTRVHIIDMTALLATKADSSTTYTKTETDTIFANKLSTTDTTITKQGNTFNGASQLVKLTSAGKLPNIDGSLLTGINGNLSINNLGNITSNPVFVLNAKNIGTVGANIVISLPNSDFVSGVENKVIFDFTLIVGYTVTQPSGIKWMNGIAPSSFSTSPAIRNRLEFITNDNGTTWEGEYHIYGGVETTFIRPNLSADGSLGGASFAVAGINLTISAYLGVNGVSADETYGSPACGWIFYNPVPIKLASLGILNFGTGFPVGYTLYGSNDNSTYVVLASGTNSNFTPNGLWYVPVPDANKSFYKYYKFYVTSSYGSSYVEIKEFYFDAIYIATS